MTRDPFIKPLIAQLYYLEGPSPCIKRVEAQAYVWSYRGENLAVVVSKRVRQFANCKIVESRTIDFNQPDDYDPKEWRAWCNEKHPTIEVRISTLQAAQRLAAEVAMSSRNESEWKKAFTELGSCILVGLDGRRMRLSARTCRGVTRYALVDIEKSGH
jgi:hypothetical protein